MTKKYSHLAAPIRIGNLELKNRFMKNGTGFFWNEPGDRGVMNQRNLDYFEALARGGAALITSGTSPLTRDPDFDPPGFRITDDSYIEGWKRWADVIHRHDAVAFLQIFHLGPMTPLLVEATAGVSASSIPREVSPRPGFKVARELTVPEIEDFVDLFASAAERIRKAEVDGVELNAACNHLLNNFLSRAWNLREDEYGTQSIENRTRLLVNIITEIKRRNGADFPITVLMNGQEVALRNGITTAEAAQFARAFVAAGADAIEVRAEYYTWTDDVERRESLHFPDMYVYPHQTGPSDPYVDLSRHGAGANLPMAAEIKKAVTVPVITMGRLDWELGEKAIAAGEVDIISLNRRLIADPGLPNKVLSGRIRDINPCSSCMTCYDAGEHFRPVTCRVNASFGREREFAIRPARVKKKVVVVGGGPAGMEAARVAALRGHEVVLYEKLHRLGGSLPVAAMVKGPREDIAGLVAYLDRQVHQAGVRVHLGKPATRSAIAAVHPDAVVVAAGGVHDVPGIPGIDGSNVLTGEALHRRAKALLQVVPPNTLRGLQSLPLARDAMIGRRVVIMGGRLHGCQTAEYLIGLGKQVTIVDEGSADEIGQGLLDVFLKPYLLYWLADQGVEFVTGVRYEQVTAEGLVVRTAEGTTRVLAADTVVTALPLKPNLAARNLVAGMGAEVHTIGDAAEPQLIVDAIHSGAKVGHSL